MDWFVFAIANAFLAAVSWIVLKAVQNRGARHEDSLTVFFAFLVAALLGWHAVTKTPLVFPPLWATGALVLAAVFAAISNLLLLHSFQHGSNPGLSTALFGTQAFWVMLFGLLFFGAGVESMAVFGVLLVISGVALIHVKKLGASFRWGFLALTAALMSASYWVLVMLAQRGAAVSATVILLLVVVPQIPVFFVVKLCRKEKPTRWSRAVVGLLAFGGIIGALSNLAAITAVTTSPNPGYALAINAGNAIVTMVGSWMLFKSKMHWRQALAAVIIVLGIVAIRLGTN